MTQLMLNQEAKNYKAQAFIDFIKMEQGIIPYQMNKFKSLRKGKKNILTMRVNPSNG